MQNNNRNPRFPVAIVIGGSYGIGAVVARLFGKEGWGVTVSGRSTESQKGRSSIHSVVEDIRNNGGKALAVQCDVRQAPESIDKVVEKTLEYFVPLGGEFQFMIYNSGALFLAPISSTPLKRFDLLHQINSRGLYSAIQSVLPLLAPSSSSTSSEQTQRKKRRMKMKIVVVSPPIYSRFIRGKTAYAMTKLGMTVLVHGLARELEETECAISALWPSVATESAATEMLEATEEGRSLLRKADVFAAAVLALAQEEDATSLNGKALIDEDYLRERCSWKDEDFARYQSVPGKEPPRMMPRKFPDLRVEEEEEETFKSTQITRAKL